MILRWSEYLAKQYNNKNKENNNNQNNNNNNQNNNKNNQSNSVYICFWFSPLRYWPTNQCKDDETQASKIS